MGEKILKFFDRYGPMMIASLLILVIGLLISKLIVKVAAKALKRSRLDPTGNAFLLSLLRAVLYTFVVIITLSKMNVPMTSIIAVLSAAGLAVSLALKENLSNVAGGFILMFSRPFKVGDYIKIGEAEGTVNQISIMYTRLLTLDNKAVMIPNAAVSNSTITNYTVEDTRRMEQHYSIAYSADFDKACEVIRGLLRNDKRALNSPDAPLLVMNAHKDSSVDVMLRVWVKQADYWGLYWDLIKNVKAGFDAAGIEIPFPQLDVHERA